VPLDEARFLHEPGAALVGGFELERDLVEEVEGDRGGGGLLREALEDGERALFRRKSGESLKRIGGRAFQEDEGFGRERKGGNGTEAED
jgi:hypothetical protein